MIPPPTDTSWLETESSRGPARFRRLRHLFTTIRRTMRPEQKEQVMTTRFRKKPVEVDAIQWDGTVAGATAVIDWTLDLGGTASYHEERATDTSTDSDGVEHSFPRVNPVPEHIAVRTPDATGRVFAGDWLIRGVAGDFYPCKAAMFTATYEPVPDAPEGENH